jgi:hypothetical protein
MKGEKDLLQSETITNCHSEENPRSDISIRFLDRRQQLFYETINPKPDATKTIILMLSTILKEQREHIEVSPTSDQLLETKNEIISKLQKENGELKLLVSEVKAHLDTFSARKILSTLALVFFFFSILLTIFIILNGSLIIISPIPEIILATTLSIYILARNIGK